MNKAHVLKLAVTATLISSTLTFGARRAVAAEGPSDAQIVGAVLAADQIDIEYGKLAVAKSKNKAVRDFAQRMVTEHGAMQKTLVDLTTKLGFSGESSPMSTSLQDTAVQVTEKLNALFGKEFDQFYIDNEVVYHKAVTDLVAGVFIPNALNAELKSALEGAQAMFLKHLEHARMVQAGDTARAN